MWPLSNSDMNRALIARTREEVSGERWQRNRDRGNRHVTLRKATWVENNSYLYQRYRPPLVSAWRSYLCFATWPTVYSSVRCSSLSVLQSQIRLIWFLGRCTSTLDDAVSMSMGWHAMLLQGPVGWRATHLSYHDGYVRVQRVLIKNED